jgi:serine/alanine adding enzyme
MITGSDADVVPVGDVRVVPASEWDSLAADLAGGDTYTLAAYHEVSALLEPPGTRPVFLHVHSADGDIALPLLLRPLPDGHGWDATTPYGYGGPLSRNARDAGAFGRALDAWARRNGVVSTFLRLHPILDNARLVPRTAELVELGSTAAWDVSPGRDLMSHMHAHHRRSARRAAQAGLQVTVIPDPHSLEGFRKLYEATMRRQEAAPFFFFPDSTGPPCSPTVHRWNPCSSKDGSTANSSPPSSASRSGRGCTTTWAAPTTSPGASVRPPAASWRRRNGRSPRG